MHTYMDPTTTLRLYFLSIVMEPTCFKTFAENYKNSYILGPSYEHYQCCNLWVNKTRAPRVSGTVFFRHKYVTNPTVSLEDSVIAAVANLADALKKNHTT